MKLGLHIVDYTFPGGATEIATTLTEVAQAAEAAGFDSIAVGDHVWQSPYLGGPERAVIEGYMVLAYMAAHTQRVKLMTLATAVTYRPAGLLAKMVTTLDVLSGGRAWLGIGAGHFEMEARGLGLPLPPMAERFEILEETIQVCLKMWSGEHGDDGAFDGEHVKIERALNLPQNLTRPHPPIMVAGEGERKTLRLVARYAAACSFYPMAHIPHKLEVLRGHCEAEGRDYDSIEKTCTLIIDLGERGENIGQLIEQLHWLAGMGIETVFVQPRPVAQVPPLEVVGREVIPAIAEL